MAHFTGAIGPTGALIDVTFWVSSARLAALKAEAQPVPDACHGRALLDTGASSTAIDPSVLKALELPPLGTIPVLTPSTGNVPHDASLYDVSIAIPPALAGEQALVFPRVPVTASQLLESQGIHALVGRDVLARCVLIWNGAYGQFTLCCCRSCKTAVFWTGIDRSQ